MKIFQHFKKVCQHKFWVFYYACQLGIPFRGFMHDWSKFHPVEFFESAKFYTGTSSPINEAKKVYGHSKAWMHHKAHNKHHHEYWLYINSGEVMPIKIPRKYVIEMIADWLGAGRAYMGSKFTIEAECEFALHKLEEVKNLMHPTTWCELQQFWQRVGFGKSHSLKYWADKYIK